MGAEIRQSYKGNGVTLHATVVLTDERVSKFAYEAMGEMFAAVEEFMANFPIETEGEERADDGDE